MNIAPPPAVPVPPTILIVGGGFAGAVLALRLLEQDRPLRIVIAEPRPEIGRGLAYSTAETVHLVNGPTLHFSVHPDAPDHLADWVRSHGPDGDWTPPNGDLTDSFIPRRVFGTYVVRELDRAIHTAQGRATVEHLRDSLTALTREGGGWIARTAGDKRIAADQVVLATGVFPFADGAAALDDPRHVRDPWDPQALDRIAGTGDVLLIGASLSMVDMVASLESRGHRGRYHAISRRGHLIEPRRLPPEDAPEFLDAAALPRTARGLLRAVNAQRKAIVAAGGDWQSLLGGLRGHILPLSQGAATAERLRFNRHLRALWDVSLHRAAPPSFAAVERARAEGRFTASAARLIGLAAGPEGLTATIRPRGSRASKALSFDAVIDCRGHQEHDWRRVTAPLPRQLLTSGAVRPHATGFGVDATERGEVIGRDGGVTGDLFALGHPMRGVAWESSSIPEQLTQSAGLADLLRDRATAAIAA
ncbi:FAD/NAD(P)-binding protein [Paracoccus sp. S3-43]|uniref:FAD/NAD(P)-binding protein n=1 Tax=Paracoccus sp. S3-43 TaxID=3030011 RepID=UPI0023B0E96A|nr:FAD/NAD(P)-binding protein [Paracoccus sp. S3-43]WEF25590.1 FAD/NAD(P)-binding protein [Paracoccus sp. S3-43]